jgi:quercetin dioxygenase-like cupin family protein
MQSWDLKTVETEPHQPQILASADDARTIVLHLPAGEELQEHEVHERARVVVVDGAVDVTTSGGESVSASSGHLFEFDPGERRTVSARSDARLLLILTPWPGDGHPGAMTLEQKAEVRERAAEHSEPPATS